MGAIREQFRLNKLKLQNETASDFYLGCWQWNRMALPMLCIRFVLFLGCLGILLTSVLLPEMNQYINYWLIYFTQWALVMITITCLLATAVSAVAYFKGPIDATFGLPWYIRLFWLCFCISVPMAFYVTIFYYSFLLSADEYEEYELNPVLDVFVHGINSVIMFTLLMTSSISLYFIQFVYPAMMLVAYMVFSIIYYYAGGTNPLGDRWIYPMLDWSQPGTAVAVVFICAALIISVFIVTVFMVHIRDKLARRFCNTTLHISNYT